MVTQSVGGEMAGEEGTRDFWRLVVAYFAPPVGVFMQVGLGVQFWVNLLLTFLLFWVGGQVHAAWVITSTRDGGQADPGGGAKLVSTLVAFYLPPVGVLMKAGVGVSLLVNLVLWVLGWFPGVIHALWVITHDE